MSSSEGSDCGLDDLHGFRHSWSAYSRHGFEPVKVTKTGRSPYSLVYGQACRSDSVEPFGLAALAKPARENYDAFTTWRPLDQEP
jgi:hypothetical protein